MLAERRSGYVVRSPASMALRLADGESGYVAGVADDEEDREDHLVEGFLESESDAADDIDDGSLASSLLASARFRA